MNILHRSLLMAITCMAAGFAACSDMIADSSGGSCSGARGGCTPSVRGINPGIEWEWTGSTVTPLSNQVMSAPAVANLDDDNGDGLVDADDIPDIIFVTFTSSPADYQNNGILRATGGDGGGDLFSVTGYNISPSTNIAVGDIDGDGLVEIIVREGYPAAPAVSSACSPSTMTVHSCGEAPRLKYPPSAYPLPTSTMMARPRY